MKIKLAGDLEKALLRAIAEGVCPPDIVSVEELSKLAKQVYESVCYLFKHHARAPLTPTAILLTAQSLFGVDKEQFKVYLKSFAGLGVGDEVVSILKAAREKTLLVRLINEAGTQLAKGVLDVGEISKLVEKNITGGSKPAAMSLSVVLQEPWRRWRRPAGPIVPR